MKQNHTPEWVYIILFIVGFILLGNMMQNIFK